MNRLQFIELIKGITIGYPETLRQLQSFFVITSDNDFLAANLGATERNIVYGDAWVRKLEQNLNNVNDLAVEYPCVAISNRSEIVEPNTTDTCQNITTRWLVEVTDTVDVTSSNSKERTKSQLDYDLFKQSRYIIEQVYSSSLKANFIVEPINITMNYYGSDNLRIAQFELQYNHIEKLTDLP